MSVGFEKPVFWNYEDDGEITVRVVMAGRSDTPITVLFTTYNVHALGKYICVRQTFVWSNGLVFSALDSQSLGPGSMLRTEVRLSILSFSFTVSTEWPRTRVGYPNKRCGE